MPDRVSAAQVRGWHGFTRRAQKDPRRPRRRGTHSLDRAPRAYEPNPSRGLGTRIRSQARRAGERETAPAIWPEAPGTTTAARPDRRNPRYAAIHLAPTD